MKRIANAFWSEHESRATVDWLVLMAGVLSLGFAIAATLAGSTHTASAEIHAPQVSHSWSPLLQ